MSSTESSYKFDERLALAQARAKLLSLVGAGKADEIYQEALSNATQGSKIDEAAMIEAIEQAYDHKARRDSLA